jgi:trk system potassium uptake protein TrkA
VSRKTSRNFIVIGLGTFGTTVATELMRFGNYVLGIDRDEAVVNRMADTLSQTVIADGRDEDAFKELGLDAYDVAVIAMGENLEGSVVTALSLKLAGVPQVWAKATSRMHHRILTRIGVDRIIHPEEEIGRHIAQMLNNPLVRDYVSLGNGFHVVNIVVPERMAGRSVTELRLMDKFDLRCVGVMKGTEYKGDATNDCALTEGDLLLLLGDRASLLRFADSV